MRYQYLRVLENKRLLGVVMSVFLIALVFIQLYPTLNSYFVADDFQWLSFSQQDDSFLNAAFHPSIGDWTTPLSNVIFWVWFQTFGLDPRGYFLMIVLVHLFNSWLVYRLVNLVTERVSLAYVSSLIFALHFIHFSDWGPLVWISAFVQLVMASFYLLSLWLFVRFLHFGKRYTYVGALVGFALALASKETAITLPLLLLIFILIEKPPVERRMARIAMLLGPFLILSGMYLLYKLLIQQTSDRYFEIGLYGFGEHLVTNWKYFSNLVMPNPESPPVRTYLLRIFPTWALSLAYLVVNLSRLGLMIAGIALWWRGTSKIRLWIALSIITYLPFIGFVGGHAGANRYFYLPAIGFSVLLASGLLWLFNHVQKQWHPMASMSFITIIILGFGAYNLVPIRAWQKAMQADSQPIQQALNLVGKYIANETTPVSKFYLTGFPPAASRNLQRAIRLVYGTGTSLVFTENPDETELPTDAVSLLYDANRVVLRQP